MSHHRRALVIVLLALAADAVCGWLYGSYEHIGRLHGMYCGLANGVTVGCDVGPQHAAGYVVDAIECALVVPLFAAAISLFTSGLTSGHVTASENRVKARIEDRLHAHVRGGAEETGARIAALAEQVGNLAETIQAAMAARAGHDQAVAADVKAARTAAESAFVATQALAAVATAKPGKAAAP